MWNIFLLLESINKLDYDVITLKELCFKWILEINITAYISLLSPEFRENKQKNNLLLL